MSDTHKLIRDDMLHVRMSLDEEERQRQSELSPAHGSVICGDCKTVHDMGNGITCAADKRGHMHLHSHCPTCGHKTWSEPFVMRSMTKAEIAAVLSSRLR